MVIIKYYTVPGTSRYTAVKAQKTKPIDWAKVRKQRKQVACDTKYKIQKLDIKGKWWPVTQKGKREPNVQAAKKESGGR